MSTSPAINEPEGTGDLLLNKPVKVCLHVVRDVTGDVRAMRTITALADAGCTVTIVDISDAQGQQKSNACVLRSATQLSHLHFYHISVSREFSQTRFAHGTLAKALCIFVQSSISVVRQQVDIYHASEVTALPACYLAAWLRRKPLIFDAYELPLYDKPVSELNYSRRLLRSLFKIFLRIALPRCAAVIAVSPLIVAELQKTYHLQRVVLIRNVPAYRSVRKTDQLRAFLKLPSQVRIALYQGALTPERSLDKLIYAAKFLEQNMVIVLMGPGTRETVAPLEALIQSEGVADRVKILPAVPYEELLDWTASADIGLIIFSPTYSLSIQMCLPNKLFEYLMAGLPILSSPLSAITEIVEEYHLGQIVQSLDPTDIGLAVNTMLKDNEMLAHMHANTRTAAHIFCWGKEHHVLLQLYQDVLEMYEKKI